MAAVQYPSNPVPHVVVQGQPGAPPMQIVAQQPATVMVQNPNFSEAYNAKSAKVTGWIQLSCAVACIVIGTIEIIVGSLLSVVGTGIWSGLLIILPTGILGIVSQNKNTCVIVAYMVMSIISALDGVVVFSMGITSAIVSSDLYSSYGYEKQRVQIAFDSLLTIIGVLELIVAIVAACYCCAGVCCGRTSSSANPVVYHHNVTPTVMMVPAYGQPVSGQQQPARRPARISQRQGHYPNFHLTGGQRQPARRPARVSQHGQRQGHYPAPVGYPQRGNTQGPRPSNDMGAAAPDDQHYYSQIVPHYYSQIE